MQQQQPPLATEEVDSLLCGNGAALHQGETTIAIAGGLNQLLSLLFRRKRLLSLLFLVLLSMLGVGLMWTAETSIPQGLKFTRHEQIAQRQIDNYRENRNGLLINVHLTHQGGTTFCGSFGWATGRAPQFACMGPRDDLTAEQTALYPSARPWVGEATAQNVEAVRHDFNYTMISWEFSKPPSNPPLSATDWEYEHLLSVFVIRNPLSRLLAGDGYSIKAWSDVIKHHNATIDTWWDFAKWKKADNFALRILAGNGKGKEMTEADFGKAKELMQRFSVLIDIDCLGESLLTLADLTNVTLSNRTIAGLQNPKKKHKHPPLEERYPYPEVYRHLQELNRFDIMLYEWAKTQVSVNCSSL